MRSPTIQCAIIGAAIRTDRWEEAPLGRVSLRLAPRRHSGFAARVSVAF
ncbi:MAG: hypothetical protein ACE5HT_13450 [Gemmatimonadales bacterium]